jgi:hypothetical protein
MVLVSGDKQDGIIRKAGKGANPSLSPISRYATGRRTVVHDSLQGYDAVKDVAMIELRDDQLRALNASEQPPVAVDPRTGQEYLLIR